MLSQASSRSAFAAKLSVLQQRLDRVAGAFVVGHELQQLPADIVGVQTHQSFDLLGTADSSPQLHNYAQLSIGTCPAVCVDLARPVDRGATRR
jgi:hypothetical protein